jgi:hypothetical protein
MHFDRPVDWNPDHDQPDDDDQPVDPSDLDSLAADAELACRYFGDPVPDDEAFVYGMEIGWLTSLDVADLERLASFGYATVAKRAPRLGYWLDDIATAEQIRRLCIASGRGRAPEEPQPVRLSMRNWTNRELSQAVFPAQALAAVVRSPALKKFLGALSAVILTDACIRLEKSASSR